MHEEHVNTLRILREATGLTQKELGEKVGVTGSSISYIEHGVNVPNVITAQRIARALGVDVADLWRAS
jgi:transcriptional regulator with XRE-family HTH domain